ncbi:MAG: hypothetical protein KatS3mg104_0261 [Phycisphaerae bacterium]|nr:MAG: hypothetical protein KatS3mg104_0261 [Phycisphaerae bacterium]
MSLEITWITLLLLPIVGLMIWKTIRLDRVPGGLIVSGLIFLILASTDPKISCERPLRIVAAVDVSPSTRGAVFRNPEAVRDRIRQLFPGRQVRIEYFADGPVKTSHEVNCSYTRLPSYDADILLLMSDGRFEASPVLPQVYVLYDPSLDSPNDAQVTELEWQETGLRVGTIASNSGRTLELNETQHSFVVPKGSWQQVVTIPPGPVTARLDLGDLWPENDQLSTVPTPGRDDRPWIIQTKDDLPEEPFAYLSPSAIFLPTNLSLTETQQDRLIQYVKDLGGSLIVSGSMRDLAPRLRSICPLSGVPPTPQAQWLVLLDASGSMSGSDGGGSRWKQAVRAAIQAVNQLEPNQNVTVALFSRSLQELARSVSPSQAGLVLQNVLNHTPSGPTGLESALFSLAASPSSVPTRVLLLTDADVSIESPTKLTDELTRAGIRLFTLSTSPRPVDESLRRVIEKTGGQLIRQHDPNLWQENFQQLLTTALGNDRIDPQPVTTSGELTGMTVSFTQLFRAFTRSQAETILSTADHPVAATWQVGLGRVTAVAGLTDLSTQQRLIARLKRPASDPRFRVRWENDRVRLLASDSQSPVNQLLPQLIDGKEVRNIPQTAPGRYEVDIIRSINPRLLKVVLNNRLIDARVYPGRYDREFQSIGNDHQALKTIADRTGGQVIPPGSPIPSTARLYEFQPVAPHLCAVAVILLGTATVLLRDPSLVDRLIYRYARRKVR